ncbi:MAG: DUF6273 domain-containing protein, partial [Clostridia bacterium]
TTAGSANVTDKLFPLASGSRAGDSYPAQIYLKSNDIRCIWSYWWLRSSYNGNAAYTIYHNGGFDNTAPVDASYGVRPAFVLKIT